MHVTQLTPPDNKGLIGGVVGGLVVGVLVLLLLVVLIVCCVRHRACCTACLKTKESEAGKDE